MHRSHRSSTCARRALSSLLCITVTALGCVGGNAPLAARAGAYDHEGRLRIAFRGFEVNVAGGNLLLRRSDFSIDTRLGTIELGASYNSASREWRWSHELELGAEVFVDASGARHALDGVAAGERIPGSAWIYEGPGAVRTRGGLVHRFAPSGVLALVHWRHAEYPQLRFSRTAVDQCTDAAACSPVFSITRDVEGRIVAIDDRAGRHAEYTWSAAGMQERALDPLSYEAGLPGARYEYEGLFPDRLSAIETPDGERFEIVFALVSGRLRAVREPAEPGMAAPTVEFHFERDPASDHNVTRVVNALGAECRFEFDDERRLVAQTNAAGDVWSWGWQGTDRVWELGPGGAAREWSHGPEGVSETNALGNVITTLYAPHAVNREAPFEPAVAERSDALGTLEERVYDAHGRIVRLRDAVGDETTWTYHADGLVASRTSPLEGELSFDDYGEHGHAGSIEHAEVIEDPLWDVPPVYDAVGNLVRGPQIGATLAPGRPGIVERRFDAGRRIVHLTLGAQEARPGFLPSELYLDYDAGELAIERRHDGQPLRILRPHGADSELDYDAQGRLVARRDRSDGAWVPAVAITYDAVGNVLRVELPNGMAEEVDYDAQNRPVAQRTLRHGQLEQSLLQTYRDGRVATTLDSELGAIEAITRDVAGNPVQVDHPGGERLERVFDLRGREVVRRYWMPDGAGGLAVLRQITRVWDAGDRLVELWDGAELVRAQSVAGRSARFRRSRPATGWCEVFTHDAARVASQGASRRVDAERCNVVESHRRSFARTASGPRSAAPRLLVGRRRLSRVERAGALLDRQRRVLVGCSR